MMKISITGSTSGSKPVQYLPTISVSLSVLAVFLILTSVLLIQKPNNLNFEGHLLFIDRHLSFLNDNLSYQAEDTILQPGHADNEVESMKSAGTSEAVKVVNLEAFFAAKNGTSSSGVNLASSNFMSSSENNRIVNSRSCDLYHGKWIYNKLGTLYYNNSCPIINPKQNCQGNGRPDKDYENWRWQPEQCNLPRFDARKFLQVMRGKTLAFVGDSLARNQMESLVCTLWQVEVPRETGSRQFQRWRFKSTSTTIIRIWSSWLVYKTVDHFPSVPDDVVKVHLDIPDKDFMKFLPKFHVVVISTGHWFNEQFAYFLNGSLVGGQFWKPNKYGNKHIDHVNAFSNAVETSLTAIATHPNFTGLTIFRTYSPDHYEKGTWNAGGSCSDKLGPVTELAKNEYTKVIYQKQIDGFKHALKVCKNKSKMILLDIMEPFKYRPDGHPGPYTGSEPNKITERRAKGRPPPPRQDCLHWCMPGPVDTWNEFLLELIQREFKNRETIFSS